MKKVLVTPVFIAFCAISTNVTAHCYNYDYAETILSGEVVLKALDLVPKARAAHRKPNEKHTFLKLEEPICITPGTNSHESGEANQSELTLYNLKGEDLGEYSGKHVLVHGVLMHAVASDSHTSLLFVVNDVVDVLK